MKVFRGYPNIIHYHKSKWMLEMKGGGIVKITHILGEMVISSGGLATWTEADAY